MKTLRRLCPALLLIAVAAASAQTPPVVIKLTLHDTVQPISAQYLHRGLAEAARTHAALVILSLDTPGGLLDSTRAMVDDIERSPVPVAVFISPTGARAGSAGFFLLEAADIAAMAPGSNAGASHPILPGRTLDPILKEKIENDAAAFLRSFTARRGRNVEAAESAVRNSKSYSDTEALNLHLIDVIAPDDQSLLAALPTLTLHRFNGTPLTFLSSPTPNSLSSGSPNSLYSGSPNSLSSRSPNFLSSRSAAEGSAVVLDHPTIHPIPPSPRERFLTLLTNPDLAVLLLIAGVFFIYTEFNIPGTVIPGALGTLMVLLALFGLNLLPVRHTAVALVVAGFLLMLLEFKITSHGIVAFTGVVSLVIGLATLVDAPIRELQVHTSTALAAGISFGLISFWLAWIALRARRNKVLLGPQSIIGKLAIVRTELHPAGQPVGQVEVRGEIWQAILRDPTRSVAPGAHVLIREAHGLQLTVDAAE